MGERSRLRRTHLGHLAGSDCGRLVLLWMPPVMLRFCFVEIPKREAERIGEDGQHNSLHEKWEDSFLPLKDKEPSDPRAFAQI